MEDRKKSSRNAGALIFAFLLGFVIASIALLTSLWAFPERFGYMVTEAGAERAKQPEGLSELEESLTLPGDTEPETIGAETEAVEAEKLAELGGGIDEAAAFRESLWRAIARFQDGGGYDIALTRSTGFPQSTWDGLDHAFSMGVDGRPILDLSQARPSFCSSACYMALVAALADWDETGTRIPTEAWRNLKPYVLHDGGEWPFQYDGMGCWGRANANGPGFAMLVSQLGVGVSGYIGGRDEYADATYKEAWDATEPGDFLKLFWNSLIGSDSKSGRSESGHLVILLKRVPLWDEDGRRNDKLYYWSSNGRGTDVDGGYGIASCRIADVRRAVWTRITNPDAFRNAAEVAPDDTDAWLSALDKHRTASVEEMKAVLSGADMVAYASAENE